MTSSTERPWSVAKSQNLTLGILENAEKGQYGVLAVIAYNIEHILAFVAAAEKVRSPLIIQFFPWAITFSSGLLIRTAADAARRASVPVAIHLDHAQDPELIRLAASTLPFDSIMIDMSHYDKADNLRLTAELVRFCHDRGIATEAEPGRIEGGEDGVQDTGALEGMKTTPEEVYEFEATGVDCLAPAFGNVHGEYGPQGPSLDFERLAEVRKNIGGRLRMVLHGTNGFPPDLMQQCIRSGLSKINVNRLVLDDYLEHLKENAAVLSTTALMEAGVAKTVTQTVEWMEIVGSAGKAPPQK